MKTPQKWQDAWLAEVDYKAVMESDIAAIQADARAGMVPEADLVALRKEVEAYDGDLTRMIASAEGLVKERDEARAELVKAWEAGRDAAADWLEKVWDVTQDAPSLTVSKVRALQPPGGKAK